MTHELWDKDKALLKEDLDEYLRKSETRMENML